jgi:cytochrome c-type biogenesis protein
MTAILIGFGSALWLGIMTSISPCPLATNIAAISFLSKRIAHPFFVLLSGIAYTAGRMFSYASLGFFIVRSLLNVPQAAMFLQTYMNKAIGPILLATGLVLLEVIKFHLPSLSISHKHHNKLAESGVLGSLVLGVIFALAFCPVSAALFFGSLVPLALQHDSGILMPLIYGIGTGLPVMIFALAMSLGVNSLTHWFKRLTKLEYYMRKITGAIFVLVGMYYINAYLLKFF